MLWAHGRQVSSRVIHGFSRIFWSRKLTEQFRKVSEAVSPKTTPRSSEAILLRWIRFRLRLREAAALALEIGVRHVVLPTDELSRAGYRENAGDRCYHCKKELFVTVAERRADIAPAEWPVVYGAITDDLGDHRPGQEAAREHQVLAPLLSAGFSKDDVRRYSRDAGLANAEKPSFACLSSRVPYGTAIDRELLGQIERAEAVLRAHGFLQFRVRHHDSLARIEVAAEELERAFEMREVLGRDVQAAGYKFVAIDVFGYRSGAMNALLAQPEDRSDPLS